MSALADYAPPDQGQDTTVEIAWPILDQAALYGLPGEIVRCIEPHTEADPVALLVNILLCAGNAAGPTPHALAEGSRHTLNEFAVLVGATAKGRKGSSFGRVRSLFEQVDALWRREHITSGLSSGEGLISAVRDGSETLDKDGKPVDAGVLDKRLLVIEEEFASTLKVMTRESNILSAIIRQAWDSGMLRVMTRTNPLRATGAHISIIGHITRDEATRYLKETEMANGFANRFLWVCVKRSKSMPDGGGMPAYGRLTDRLYEALQFARSTTQPVVRDAEASRMWHAVYGTLSEGKPGLLGGITSRAEAHVLRLSVLYALLDRSPQVRPPHLDAAVALWEYCEQSVQWIFGTLTGNKVADRIYGVLCSAGMQGQTLSDLRDALGQNVSSERMREALDALETMGLVTKEVAVFVQGKRPRTTYRVADTGGSDQ